MLWLFNAAGSDILILAELATLLVATKGKLAPINSVQLRPSVEKYILKVAFLLPEPLVIWAKSAVSKPAVLPEKSKFKSQATAVVLSVEPLVKKTNFVPITASFPIAVLEETTGKERLVATVVFVAAGIVPTPSIPNPFQLVP